MNISSIIIGFVSVGLSMAKIGGLSENKEPVDNSGTVSVSVLLSYINNNPVLSQMSNLSKISENFFNDSDFYDFRIKTESDTVYFKVETTVEAQNLAVWNRDKFLYKGQTIQGNGLINFVNDSSRSQEVYKRFYKPFFDLVEKWDTAYLRSREYQLHTPHAQNTVVSRVIYKNNTFKLDAFKFYRIRLKEMGKDSLVADFNRLVYF